MVSNDRRTQVIELIKHQWPDAREQAPPAAPGECVVCRGKTRAKYCSRVCLEKDRKTNR